MLPGSHAMGAFGMDTEGGKGCGRWETNVHVSGKVPFCHVTVHSAARRRICPALETCLLRSAVNVSGWREEIWTLNEYS